MSKNDVKIGNFYKLLHNFYKLQNKKKSVSGKHSQRNYDYKEYQCSDYRLPNWPQLCLNGTHAVLTPMSSMTFQGRESNFFRLQK